MQTMNIGEVEVIRVNELDADALTMVELLLDSDRDEFERNRELLAPEHWDPETNIWRASVHTYVLRSGEGKRC